MRKSFNPISPKKEGDYSAYLPIRSELRTLNIPIVTGVISCCILLTSIPTMREIPVPL